MKPSIVLLSLSAAAVGLCGGCALASDDQGIATGPDVQRVEQLAGDIATLKAAIESVSAEVTGIHKQVSAGGDVNDPWPWLITVMVAFGLYLLRYWIPHVGQVFDVLQRRVPNNAKVTPNRQPNGD